MEKYSDLRDEGFLHATLTDGQIAKIDSMEVYPTERNKVVGSSLLNALTQYCKTKAITRIDAVLLPEDGKTLDLARFYNKNGFIIENNKASKSLV